VVKTAPCDQAHCRYDELHKFGSKMNMHSDYMEKLRSEDHARFLTILYAPRNKRESLLALALLNVELARIRDSVSEPMIGEVRLAWWREAVADLYAGKVRKHEVLQALMESNVVRTVPQPLLDSMIEARIDDIYDAQPATLDVLDDYLGRTSGQLQQAICYILCESGPSADTLSAAHHVGCAWGLVGIVRAVGFHAMQQRRYIPDAALQAAGIAPESLVQQPITAALAPALKSVVDHARAALVAARQHQRAAQSAAYPALALGLLAEDYANRLAKVDYDPLRFGAIGGDVKRQWLLLRGSLTRCI
jgi:NADH dehydrogenase [ubiquinone] 1 alpha subcomplex assembly factor 6